MRARMVRNMRSKGYSGVLLTGTAMLLGKSSFDGSCDCFPAGRWLFVSGLASEDESEMALMC